MIIKFEEVSVLSPNVPYSVMTVDLDKTLDKVPLFKASLSIFASQFGESEQCNEIVGLPGRKCGIASCIVRGGAELIKHLHKRLLHFSPAKVNEQMQETKNSDKISAILAYSDKMLFLDLGPGTSDLGSLI